MSDVLEQSKNMNTNINRSIKETDPEVTAAIREEVKRQNDNIELIASENFTSQAVMEAQGSALTNKYAEGYPEKRWYGGCENVDVVENLAIERAKKLFNAEFANVQPHSGTSANTAVFMALLEPGDKILGFNLAHGGHLSHGHPMNFSGKYFDIIPYGVTEKDEMIDYDELEKIALEAKPKLIILGASAYSRIIDFKRGREIADKVGAILMADIAHFAGLVVSGDHPAPFPHCDIVTTTTHKTLRGPRSGLIMAKEKYGKAINSAVFPGVQGGPLMHVIAAKAVAFKEALEPEFKAYGNQVVKNAKALAEAMQERGYRIVSGGTDNHLMLVDVTSKGLNGKEVQELLDHVRITVNKNAIPFDKLSPFKGSGVRLGTPAVTTRGMKEEQMKIIAGLIDDAIVNREDSAKLDEIRDKVDALTKEFPLYPNLEQRYQ